MKKRFLMLGLVGLGLSLFGKPAQALPMWAREYKVSCSTCHTVAPTLNSFGEAFLANNFAWPGMKKNNRGLLAVPVSGLATFEYEKAVSGEEAGPKFAELELFSGDSFRVGKRPTYFGSYFLTALTAHAAGGGRAGDLEQAYATLPVAGQRGQLSLGVGQTFPLMYQFNPLNQHFDSNLLAFDRGARGFSPTGVYPGVRLDYFNNRGKSTRNGDYFSVMVPFDGTLAFNDDARWGDSNGVFLHAFRRWSNFSAGVSGWMNAGDYQVGALATYDIWPTWRFIGSLYQNQGRDDRGLQASLEANYFFNDSLGLLGRVEGGGGGGSFDGFAVGGVWYPERKYKALRIAVEHRQFSGDRATLVRAIGQF